jgi:hypothetical protein
MGSELLVEPAISRAAAQHPSPTLNDIRERAYRKWVAAGMPSGNGYHFWLEAEEELLHER